MKTFNFTLITLVLFTYRGYTQDTIELKKYVSNLKKVEVTIEGYPYSFLFDTGGGETFIAPEVARRLGKTTYGNATTFRMSGEKLNYQKCDSVAINIGSTTIFHLTAGVWDLMSILPAGLPKLDGVLSLKSFKDKIVTIDLSHSKLILETSSSYLKSIKKKTLLPSRFASGIDGNELTIFLKIPNQNRSYWFLFDSGNLNNLLLSHRTAYEWGLQSDTVTQRKELNTVNIHLGTRKTEARSASENIIYDGALNYEVLSKSVFTINFPKKEVWMQ